ncbi:MAG TPA: glycogen-binding domain-containing protein [Verrucomicrobiae bacterium]|nr:glycogen-binding domain-containing protein [Verrucomicrobiae bacterium]
MTHKHSHHPHGHKPAGERKQVFTKNFRWRLPAGQTEVPHKIEVAGTFSDWKKIEMKREVSGGWQVALHDIPGNRTHHYMFFADGKPVRDEHCDGLAIPADAKEEHLAIVTPRGPRVFMLFSQTK